MNLPILYSYRRCPYAMRARMALLYSSIPVEIREITLRDKPPSMLQFSPKGTVPVLVLPDNQVLEESLDIMHWALKQQDTDNWLMANDVAGMEAIRTLITENDSSFKKALDRYKYANRFPEHSAEYYRNQGEAFLSKLESRLSITTFLSGEHCTQADIAIFPFIRQFAMVDEIWFEQAPFPKLKCWLQNLLQSAIFIKAMEKFPPWKEGQTPVIFGKEE